MKKWRVGDRFKVSGTVTGVADKKFSHINPGDLVVEFAGQHMMGPPFVSEAVFLDPRRLEGAEQIVKSIQPGDRVKFKTGQSEYDLKAVVGNKAWVMTIGSNQHYIVDRDKLERL